MAREAVVAAITFATPAFLQPGPADAAIALRAALAQVDVLAPASGT